MKKFWKLRCCCRSKNIIEPGLHERVIDEGDDNPAFEATKTATINQKFRSSVYLESLDKTAMRSRNNLNSENAKKVEIMREQSHDSTNMSSSIMLKEELSDM